MMSASTQNESAEVRSGPLKPQRYLQQWTDRNGATVEGRQQVRVPFSRVRIGAPAKGFPRRLTLRRDHLLLGEAQNGGAIALAGHPGSLEAIDRRSGQPKIVVAL